jgi:hypothetical protein
MRLIFMPKVVMEELDVSRFAEKRMFPRGALMGAMAVTVEMFG